MTDVENKRKVIINIVYYGLILALCYFFLKYALGTLFPIVCALIIAAILQKPKKLLVRKAHLKKGLASVLCVFGGLILVLFFISLIGVRVATEIKGFVDYIIIQLQNIDTLVNEIEGALSSIVSALPDFLSTSLQESINLAFVQIREWLAGSNTELPGQITSSIGGAFDLSWITTPLSGVISTASKIPSVIIAVIITIVAACFMTADFDTISGFIRCQLPEKKYRNFLRTKTLLKSSLTKMAKAYLCIIGITFCEMLLGLGVLSVLGIYSSSYILIISLITAIIDIIPVLGTGTVLLPWAVYNLIVGDFAMAIGLLVIYAVITIVRQVIEPKFVAGQLGLPSFLTISVMYIGLKTFGVLGMLVAPLVVVTIKLLNDEGIIKLWKSPSAVMAKKKEEESEPQPEAAEKDKPEA